MESRFNGHKANLRAYLRKRGAEIDVKNKTVKVDMEALNKKEQEKLKELERWGYKVNEQQTYFSTHSPFGIMKYLRQKIIHLSHLLMR